MKKIYMKLFAVLFTGLIGISANAQGVWMADSMIALINPSTEITTGITGLTMMHSDPSGVTGHGETAALDTTYNDVHWNNEAFIQGTYYAIRTASEGSLDVALKMSSNKITFVLELTDACPNNADLAALTAAFGTGDAIFGTASYFTLPTVFDTYTNSEGTWNGTTPIQSSGSSVFMFMTFPVAANKTYVIGCLGSKMMVRGLNYVIPVSGVNNINAAQAPEIFPNPAAGYVIIRMNRSAEIGIYNTVGILVKQQLVTPSNNHVDISGLTPGVYFIKEMNGNNKTQKLIVN